MTLDKYLSLHNITSSAFAKKGRWTIHAVHKWRQKKRIPRPTAQLKIKKLSNNLVDHKDWYE